MYEQLDFLIVENIRAAGEARLAVATGGRAQKEAERIAAATKRVAFRVLDARLQALRKRGLIVHVGGAWRAVSARPAHAWKPTKTGSTS